MAINGEQLGAFIAEEMGKMKPAQSAPVMEPAPATVVNIDTDNIASAIVQSRLEIMAIASFLTQIVKSVEGVELAGVQDAIRGMESTDLSPVVDALTANSEAIMASKDANAQALAGIVSALGDSQAAQLSAVATVLDRQSAQIAGLAALTESVIEALLADRDLIFDEAGNPTGIRIDRQFN